MSHAPDDPNNEARTQIADAIVTVAERGHFHILGLHHPATLVNDAG